METSIKAFYDIMYVCKDTNETFILHTVEPRYKEVGYNKTLL